ncbi:MAG: ATP-dependent helicase [Muribaculaceae bacterium]|nr:ATP-dependent helicase [Muribaculaceae bacterium]
MAETGKKPGTGMVNVDRIVDKCYERLSPQNRTRPWECLNHGVDVLDTTEKLDAYLASYGEMHFEKCRRAILNFPYDDFATGAMVGTFEIFDWGCGQGIGTLTLLEGLANHDRLQNVRRITLIEPSEIAVARAERWVKYSSHATTEVRVIRRQIPSDGSAYWADLDCREHTAVHIFSNILDIGSVGLRWLAESTGRLSANGIYICVGPKFGGGVSRISDFHRLMGSPECFSDYAMFPAGRTRRTGKSYGIDVKCFRRSSGDALDTAYRAESAQRPIDEFDAEGLKDLLTEGEIKAYRALDMQGMRYLSELYVKPRLSVERPDFVMLDPKKGMLLVGVCEKPEDFEAQFQRLEVMKRAIFDTYVKGLRHDMVINRGVFSAIKTCLYFPNASTEEINKQCRDCEDTLRGEKTVANSGDGRESGGLEKSLKYLLCVNDGNMKTVFGKAYERSVDWSKYYKELKDLVNGSDWHSRLDGDLEFKLTAEQGRIVADDKPLMLVSGVAGSGKTQMLAHKAVKELKRTGQPVLILTFNIALIQYIRMRIHEVAEDFYKSDIKIINYHQYFISMARAYRQRMGCRRQCGENCKFCKREFRPGVTLWDSYTFTNPIFFDGLNINEKHKYQTIIVDEGQDFEPEWIQLVHKNFLKEGGRFVIFGDGDQNIYERRQDKETGLPGFSIDWNRPVHHRLANRVSKRLLNPRIASLASEYAEDAGFGQAIRTDDELASLMFGYKMGYWYTDASLTSRQLADGIRWIIGKNGLDPRHTVVLMEELKMLRQCDYDYRKQSGLFTQTSFEYQEIYDYLLHNNEEDEERYIDIGDLYKIRHEVSRFGMVKSGQTDMQKYHGKEPMYVNKLAAQLEVKDLRRVQKVHFTTMCNCLKFATIASFKGWEAKNVIVVVKNPDMEDGNVELRGNSDALLYTALTRARENLFVVNIGNVEKHEFFNGRIKNEVYD